MKIIHVVEPFAAGVATFVRQQVEMMPFDKHIIIHGDRSEYKPAEMVKRSFQARNVHFVRWPYARCEISVLHDFLAFVNLFFIMRRLPRPDAVHLHSSKAGLTGRVVCWLLGIRNVYYTPNGLSFMRQDKGWYHRSCYLLLEQLGARFPAKVVAASASEHKVLQRCGIPALWINNGTDSRIELPNSVSRKKALLRIVTSGRIEEQKGPGMFADIARYFGANAEIEFVWIGDGPLRGRLTEQNIRVTGWLDQSEVLKEVAEGDLYLSCARWEGLPFSVMEAMALGKNLLLHRCVGNEDLVVDGKNGLLFESASEAIRAIKLFWNQPFLNELMGERSRALCAEQFDVRKTAERYRMEYASGIHVDAEQILTHNPLALGEKIYTNANAKMASNAA